MEEPEHEGFVYQVLTEGQLVIVMADHEDAVDYIEDYMRGSASIILPVPVFKYDKSKNGGRRT